MTVSLGSHNLLPHCRVNLVGKVHRPESGFPRHSHKIFTGLIHVLHKLSTICPVPVRFGIGYPGWNAPQEPGGGAACHRPVPNRWGRLLAMDCGGGTEVPAGCAFYDLFAPLSCRCQMLVDILSRFYFEQSVFAEREQGALFGDGVVITTPSSPRTSESILPPTTRPPSGSSWRMAGPSSDSAPVGPPPTRPLTS